MSNFGKCHRCKSWVPQGESTCPHCEAPQGLLFAVRSAFRDLLGSQGRTQRQTGGLCVACNKLVGRDDTHCPHCGVEQTATRKAAKAALAILPGGLGATQMLMLAMAILFVIPILAMTGKMGFELGNYLSGDGRTGILMGSMFTPLVTDGDLWRIVTANYLHFGVVHIGFNLFAVSFLGRLNEQLYGSGWFVFLFVVTGVAAFTVSYFGHTDMANTAGSSGSIFGLMGLGLVYCYRNRFANREMLNTLIFWTVISFVAGLQLPMDNYAHAGGLASGALLGYLLPPETVTRGRNMNRLGNRLGQVAAVVVLACLLLALLNMGDADAWLIKRGL